jgi:hypothetical protein
MTRLAKLLTICAAMGPAALPAPAQRAASAKPPVALSWNAAVSMLVQAPIARSPLPPLIRRALERAVGDQMASGLSPSQAARQLALVPSFPLKMKALDGPGRREAVVQTPLEDCGRQGCPLVVFRWTGTRWALLLRASGGTLLLQRNRTDGWRDLAVGAFPLTGRRMPAADSRRGPAESTVRLYRFNGRKYVESGCWRAPGWQPGDRPSRLRACYASRAQRLRAPSAPQPGRVPPLPLRRLPAGL